MCPAPLFVQFLSHCCPESPGSIYLVMKKGQSDKNVTLSLFTFMSRPVSCPNPHKERGGQAVSLCFADLPKSVLLSGPAPPGLESVRLHFRPYLYYKWVSIRERFSLVCCERGCRDVSSFILEISTSELYTNH